MPFLAGFFKLINSLSTLVTLAKDGWALIQAWMVRRAISQKNEKIDEVGQELKKANEVQDDTQRLKAKAEAMCKLEKLANPDSTCDTPPPPGGKV